MQHILHRANDRSSNKISILFILCNGLVIEKPKEAVRNAQDIPTLQRFLFIYLFYLDKRPIHVEI